MLIKRDLLFQLIVCVLEGSSCYFPLKDGAIAVMAAAGFVTKLRACCEPHSEIGMFAVE